MRLENIAYRSGPETWLYPTNLSLATGEINVLLGATLAGKTTALRILAGLDRPSEGRLFDADREVTGMPVRRRNVAMVYQQFINYPSLTVFENIASPLRVARRNEKEIRERVRTIAATLRLEPFLSRYPSELSGGQQQRTALARALAKDAPLLLLDEPLANLDYKLREQLRDELRQLFKNRSTTVVYATTDPQEALQLGGHTAVLSEGRVLQFGATIDVFRRPASLDAAKAFSDPPLNVAPAKVDARTATALIADDVQVDLTAESVQRISAGTSTDVLLGIRAHQLNIARRSIRDCEIAGTVELAEISGSDTFIHISHNGVALVAQIPGVHEHALGSVCTLYVDPADWYLFDTHGVLLYAPQS